MDEHFSAVKSLNKRNLDIGESCLNKNSLAIVCSGKGTVVREGVGATPVEINGGQKGFASPSYA
jgi:hypothetical protein